MAEVWGKDFAKKCEECKMMSDPKAFARGTNVKQVRSCEDCDVTKQQPIEANLNIVELYDMLPANFEGFGGLRQISATDISFLFDLYEVKQELRFDYYQRMIYLHGQIILVKSSKDTKQEKTEMSDQEWKKQALGKHGVKRQ